MGGPSREFAAVTVWENFDSAAIMRDSYASMERFALAR